MKKEQVNNFFKTLINEESLTAAKINDIVMESALEKGWKEEILTRMKSHIECEQENLEMDEEPPFVVVKYAGKNTSLECEGCCSVIIDDEILLCE